MDDPFNFDKVIKNLGKMKQTLPKALAEDTKEYFLEHLPKQAAGGSKRKGGGKGKEVNGMLKKAVNNSLKQANWTGIIFSLNEADIQAAGKNKVTGDSAGLRKVQRKTITGAMDRIWG